MPVSRAFVYELVRSVNMEDEVEYYEGCGLDGPLRCIFLCEFHPTAGPKITCQVPDNYISKEIFDAVSVYIIPKAQLQRSILTVTVLGSKILGFPIRIYNKKYARNAFYFNLCFVCDAWARSVQYEPVVKKLSDHLITMEVEKHFLSNPQNENAPLSSMLGQVMEDLNTYRMCTLTEGTTKIHLKVVKISKEPSPVHDHQVPIFIEDQHMFRSEQWDLTTYQVLPYIDGFNHIARIATEADVENNLVKACVQNLMYYGVVSLLPIFQYSNVYAATPKLRMLAENKELQQRCIKYVSKSVRQPPALRDVFRMYSSMTYGTTVRDLCVRLNPHPLRINERKLVQFGLLNGLIRRIYKYPVHLSEDSKGIAKDSLHHSFTGLQSVDEICCAHGLSNQQFEDQVERDPDVVLIWK
ncbi:GATOR complex protein NPRL2 [Cryptotermes secundus]|uniref:GATOR complex protein NPRL2 n=1 Tax=Cryptotermes secundus TaxID=105785 RepID=UPI001454BC14|nr:GATOR complex protein NPRL2 [Cryptotermes secundus]